MQVDLESVGVTGLFQKSLGLVHIVLRGRNFFRRSEKAQGHHLVGRFAEPFQNHVDHGLAVDGDIDRFAHPCITQRVLVQLAAVLGPNLWCDLTLVELQVHHIDRVAKKRLDFRIIAK